MYVSIMSLDQGITQSFIFHFLCVFVYELKFISGRSGDSLVLMTLFVVLLSRDLNLTSPFSVIYLCKKIYKNKIFTSWDRLDNTIESQDIWQFGVL